MLNPSKNVLKLLTGALIPTHTKDLNDWGKITEKLYLMKKIEKE